VEWIDALRGTVVGLDTAPLIYFIEEHPIWLPVVQPFFNALDRGVFRVVTSTLTVTEVLVHPLRKSHTSLAEQYRHILLRANNLIALPVTADIAEKAAELRAWYGLRTPDAIQLATAIRGEAQSFFSNDKRISSVAPIRVMTLESLLSPPTG
jgi:predicted nucleic acid-binding protein